MIKLKKVNLNGKAKIKLNEKGLKRVEELVECAANSEMISNYSKKVVVKEIRKTVDEEGYLTDNLNSIMDEYDVSCFENPDFTMQDLDSHEWFNLSLNDEVIIKLNGEGVRRTLRHVSEIERDESLSDEDKKRMVEEIESSIDDENNMTTTLKHIIDNYSSACLVNQLAQISNEPSVAMGSK